MVNQTKSRSDYVAEESAKAVYKSIKAKEDAGTYKPNKPMTAKTYTSKYLKGKILSSQT